ncbi:MAG: hypothetical protein KGS44_16705, partial [Alphaproteobacteria bacterium]|nr:hypothetical protein [Alphaproteobacteria bacterium]
MGGFRVFIIAFVLGLNFYPDSARASGEKARCDKAAKEAKSACDSAAKGAEGAGQAHNAAGTAQDAASGGHNNRGSANMCPRLNNQKNNLDKAKGACEAEKAKCKATCNSEKGKDQSHCNPPPPFGQHACENPDPSACDIVDPSIAQLASAAAPLAGQAAEACKSGDQAKDGGMPQMPQMPQKQDDKKEEKKEEKKPEGLKCESDEGARYSDCNDQFITRCTSDMTQKGCDAFGARFCGTAGGSAPGAGSDSSVVGGDSSKSGGSDNISIQPGSVLRPAFANNNTTGLVVDKRGEGMSSPFCRRYSAYKFCQQTGRGHCPSCISLNASMSDTCMRSPELCGNENLPQQLEQAKDSCPMDPIFADPNRQKANSSKISTQYSTSSTKDSEGKSGARGASSSGGSAGASGGAGGSSGGAGAGGGAALDSGGALAEAPGRGVNTSAEAYGGGGAGGYSSQSSEESEKEASSEENAGARNPQAQAGPTQDIAVQRGQNLFSISSDVYKR